MAPRSVGDVPDPKLDRPAGGGPAMPGPDGPVFRTGGTSDRSAIDVPPPAVMSRTAVPPATRSAVATTAATTVAACTPAAMVMGAATTVGARQARSGAGRVGPMTGSTIGAAGWLTDPVRSGTVWVTGWSALITGATTCTDRLGLVGDRPDDAADGVEDGLVQVADDGRDRLDDWVA